MDFIVYRDNKIVAALEAKRGGKYTVSFNAFRKAYAGIAASILTEVTVFKIVDSLPDSSFENIKKTAKDLL